MDGILHLVSADGLVHGLALEDGEERWTADLGVQSNATPLIAKGVLVLGDEAGTLQAFRPSDGERRWTLTLDGPVTGAAAFDAARGLLVAATDAGTAYGVDPDRGSEVWRSDLGGPAIRSVAIADGTAYVGVTPGTIVALDTADGTVRWRRQLATEGDIMTPSVAEGRLYVGLGGAPTGHLWALDLVTGDPIWDYEVPGVAAWTPAVSDGRAYVPRTDGVVEALDSASGAVVWSVRTPSPLEALPAIVDEVLLVAGTGGPVAALDIATGETVWSIDLTGRPWSPIAADGYVVVPTDVGILYAIG